jgi:uncharacterized protein YjbI with pentapeptide repeats
LLESAAEPLHSASAKDPARRAQQTSRSHAVGAGVDGDLCSQPRGVLAVNRAQFDFTLCPYDKAHCVDGDFFFVGIIVLALAGIITFRNSIVGDHDSPFTVILLFAFLGLGLAGQAARMLAGACGKAEQKESASVFWGALKVTSKQCENIGKSPPWLLLSGLAAGPSVLLTWYWRDKKRRDDHAIALAERQAAASQLRHSEQILAAERARAAEQQTLNQQVAFATRYTKAAEMLAAPDEMTRINGLESLFDIALQSKTHRAAISRTFAAFVRTHAKPPADRPRSLDDAYEVHVPAAFVQSAIRLLGLGEWANEDWERDDVDLREVTLERCEAKGAHLPGAQLRGADLREADFEGANLQRANLERACLVHANLKGADLRGALLYEADIRGAKLVGAKLDHANFYEAVLDDADLGIAQLSVTTFNQASLKNAVLRHVHARGASFVGADLQGADLNGANLHHAILDRANLRGAILQRANLSYVALRHAVLDDVKLEGAQYTDSTIPLPFDDEEASRRGMVKLPPS